MELDNTNLRTLLSNIFNVDQKYIVQKAGIWFNPQTDLPTAEKPLTWVAYRIKDNLPIGLPYFEEESEIIEDVETFFNFAKVTKIASINLQLVGTKAEELANSMAFWIKRGDVQAEFEKVDGKLMADDMNVRTTDFYQDGFNNILAFNVDFRVVWISKIKTTQTVIDDLTITGTIRS